jgi:hypothetical protein
MLNSNDRNRLRSYRDRLQRWAADVPRDAVAFHQERTELLDQTDEALRLGGLLTSGDAAHLIFKGLQDLEGVATELSSLFARKVAVEQSIDEAIDAAASLRDEAVEQQMQSRRADWRSALVRYGTHVRRQVDLVEDRAEIEHVAALVRETREALKLLNEVRERREDAAHETSLRAPLIAGFDGWKLRFRQEGATPSLLEEIEERLTPLRLRPPRKVEEAPVATLSAVRTLIGDAQGWSSVQDGAGAFEVEEMNHHLDQIESAWPAADLMRLQELEAEARAFVEAARTKGRDTRSQILGRLQEWLRHLRASAGARGLDATLDKQLDELTGMAAETHDGFRDWIDRCARVEQYFTNFATSRRQALVNLLSERLAASLARIGAVPADQLTRSLQVDLRMVETRLATARNIVGENSLEQLFAALSNVDRDVRTIEEIKHRGDAEKRALEERRARELERFLRLRAAAMAVEARMPDLEPELTTVLSDTPSLDLGSQRLAALELQINGLTETFLERCGREVDELVAAASEDTQLLAHVTTSPVTPAPALVLAATAGPEEAAATLREARTRKAGLTTCLEQEVQRLRGERDQALADMTEWFAATDVLAPADRGAAEALQQELGAPPDTTSNAGVRVLFDLLAKHESLHERVRSDQLVSRRRAKRLAKRLQALADDGLTQFDPVGTARCFGLIEAVPFATQQWMLVKRQIEEAARLLDQLEKQGRRLAARDVEVAHAILTHATHNDPIEMRRVGHALDELRPYLDARTLAPLALRARLLRLAEGVEDHSHA